MFQGHHKDPLPPRIDVKSPSTPERAPKTGLLNPYSMLMNHPTRSLPRNFSRHRYEEWTSAETEIAKARGAFKYENSTVFSKIFDLTARRISGNCDILEEDFKPESESKQKPKVVSNDAKKDPEGNRRPTTPLLFCCTSNSSDDTVDSYKHDEAKPKLEKKRDSFTSQEDLPFIDDEDTEEAESLYPDIFEPTKFESNTRLSQDQDIKETHLVTHKLIVTHRQPEVVAQSVNVIQVPEAIQVIETLANDDKADEDNFRVLIRTNYARELSSPKSTDCKLSSVQKDENKVTGPLDNKRAKEQPKDTSPSKAFEKKAKISMQTTEADTDNPQQRFAEQSAIKTTEKVLVNSDDVTQTSETNTNSGSPKRRNSKKIKSKKIKKESGEPKKSSRLVDKILVEQTDKKVTSEAPTQSLNTEKQDSPALKVQPVELPNNQLKPVANTSKDCEEKEASKETKERLVLSDNCQATSSHQESISTELNIPDIEKLSSEKPETTSEFESNPETFKQEVFSLKATGIDFKRSEKGSKEWEQLEESKDNHSAYNSEMRGYGNPITKAMNESESFIINQEIQDESDGEEVKTGLRLYGMEKSIKGCSIREDKRPTSPRQLSKQPTGRPTVDSTKHEAKTLQLSTQHLTDRNLDKTACLATSGDNHRTNNGKEMSKEPVTLAPMGVQPVRHMNEDNSAEKTERQEEQRTFSNKLQFVENSDKNRDCSHHTQADLVESQESTKTGVPLQYCLEKDETDDVNKTVKSTVERKEVESKSLDLLLLSTQANDITEPEINIQTKPRNKETTDRKITTIFSSNSQKESKDERHLENQPGFPNSKAQNMKEHLNAQRFAEDANETCQSFVSKMADEVVAEVQDCTGITPESGRDLENKNDSLVVCKIESTNQKITGHGSYVDKCFSNDQHKCTIETDEAKEDTCQALEDEPTTNIEVEKSIKASEINQEIKEVGPTKGTLDKTTIETITGTNGNEPEGIKNVLDSGLSENDMEELADVETKKLLSIDQNLIEQMAVDGNSSLQINISKIDVALETEIDQPLMEIDPESMTTCSSPETVVEVQIAKLCIDELQDDQCMSESSSLNMDVVVNDAEHWQDWNEDSISKSTSITSLSRAESMETVPILPNEDVNLNPSVVTEAMEMAFAFESIGPTSDLRDELQECESKAPLTALAKKAGTSFVVEDTVDEALIQVKPAPTVHRSSIIATKCEDNIFSTEDINDEDVFVNADIVEPISSKQSYFITQPLGFSFCSSPDMMATEDKDETPKSPSEVERVYSSSSVATESKKTEFLEAGTDKRSSTVKSHHLPVDDCQEMREARGACMYANFNQSNSDSKYKSLVNDVELELDKVSCSHSTQDFVEEVQKIHHQRLKDAVDNARCTSLLNIEALDGDQVVDQSSNKEIKTSSDVPTSESDAVPLNQKIPNERKTTSDKQSRVSETNDQNDGDAVCELKCGTNSKTMEAWNVDNVDLTCATHLDSPQRKTASGTESVLRKDKKTTDLVQQLVFEPCNLFTDPEASDGLLQPIELELITGVAAKSTEESAEDVNQRNSEDGSELDADFESNSTTASKSEEKSQEFPVCVETSTNSTAENTNKAEGKRANMPNQMHAIKSSEKCESLAKSKANTDVAHMFAELDPEKHQLESENTPESGITTHTSTNEVKVPFVSEAPGSKVQNERLLATNEKLLDEEGTTSSKTSTTEPKSLVKGGRNNGKMDGVDNNFVAKTSVSTKDKDQTESSHPIDQNAEDENHTSSILLKPASPEHKQDEKAVQAENLRLYNSDRESSSDLTSLVDQDVVIVNQEKNQYVVKIKTDLELPPSQDIIQVESTKTCVTSSEKHNIEANHTEAKKSKFDKNNIEQSGVPQSTSSHNVGESKADYFMKVTADAREKDEEVICNWPKNNFAGVKKPGLDNNLKDHQTKIGQYLSEQGNSNEQSAVDINVVSNPALKNTSIASENVVNEMDDKKLFFNDINQESSDSSKLVVDTTSSTCMLPTNDEKDTCEIDNGLILFGGNGSTAITDAATMPPDDSLKSACNDGFGLNMSDAESIHVLEQSEGDHCDFIRNTSPDQSTLLNKSPNGDRNYLCKSRLQPNSPQGFNKPIDLTKQHSINADTACGVERDIEESNKTAEVCEQLVDHHNTGKNYIEGFENQDLSNLSMEDSEISREDEVFCDVEEKRNHSENTNLDAVAKPDERLGEITKTETQADIEGRVNCNETSDTINEKLEDHLSSMDHDDIRKVKAESPKSSFYKPKLEETKGECTSETGKGNTCKWTETERLVHPTQTYDDDKKVFLETDITKVEAGKSYNTDVSNPAELQANDHDKIHLMEEEVKQISQYQSATCVSDVEEKDIVSCDQEAPVCTNETLIQYINDSSEEVSITKTDTCGIGTATEVTHHTSQLFDYKEDVKPHHETVEMEKSFDNSSQTATRNVTRPQKNDLDKHQFVEDDVQQQCQNLSNTSNFDEENIGARKQTTPGCTNETSIQSTNRPSELHLGKADLSHFGTEVEVMSYPSSLANNNYKMKTNETDITTVEVEKRLDISTPTEIINAMGPQENDHDKKEFVEDEVIQTCQNLTDTLDVEEEGIGTCKQETQACINETSTQSTNSPYKSNITKDDRSDVRAEVVSHPSQHGVKNDNMKTNKTDITTVEVEKRLDISTPTEIINVMGPQENDHDKKDFVEDEVIQPCQNLTDTSAVEDEDISTCKQETQACINETSTRSTNSVSESNITKDDGSDVKAEVVSHPSQHGDKNDTMKTHHEIDITTVEMGKSFDNSTHTEIANVIVPQENDHDKKHLAEDEVTQPRQNQTDTSDDEEEDISTCKQETQACTNETSTQSINSLSEPQITKDDQSDVRAAIEGVSHWSPTEKYDGKEENDAGKMKSELETILGNNSSIEKQNVLNSEETNLLETNVTDYKSKAYKGQHIAQASETLNSNMPNDGTDPELVRLPVADFQNDECNDQMNIDCKQEVLFNLFINEEKHAKDGKTEPCSSFSKVKTGNHNKVSAFKHGTSITETDGAKNIKQNITEDKETVDQNQDKDALLCKPHPSHSDELQSQEKEIHICEDKLPAISAKASPSQLSYDEGEDRSNGKITGQNDSKIIESCGHSFSLNDTLEEPSEERTGTFSKCPSLGNFASAPINQEKEMKGNQGKPYKLPQHQGAKPLPEEINARQLSIAASEAMASFPVENKANEFAFEKNVFQEKDEKALCTPQSSAQVIKNDLQDTNVTSKMKRLHDCADNEANLASSDHVTDCSSVEMVMNEFSLSGELNPGSKTEKPSGFDQNNEEVDKSGYVDGGHQLHLARSANESDELGAVEKTVQNSSEKSDLTTEKSLKSYLHLIRPESLETLSVEGEDWTDESIKQANEMAVPDLEDVAAVSSLTHKAVYFFYSFHPQFKLDISHLNRILKLPLNLALPAIQQSLTISSQSLQNWLKTLRSWLKFRAH